MGYGRRKQLAQVRRAEEFDPRQNFNVFGSNLHKCAEQKKVYNEANRNAVRSNLHKCAEQKAYVYLRF